MHTDYGGGLIGGEAAAERSTDAQPRAAVGPGHRRRVAQERTAVLDAQQPRPRGLYPRAPRHGPGRAEQATAGSSPPARSWPHVGVLATSERSVHQALLFRQSFRRRDAAPAPAGPTQSSRQLAARGIRMVPGESRRAARGRTGAAGCGSSSSKIVEQPPPRWYQFVTRLDGLDGLGLTAVSRAVGVSGTPAWDAVDVAQLQVLRRQATQPLHGPGRQGRRSQADGAGRRPPLNFNLIAEDTTRASASLRRLRTRSRPRLFQQTSRSVRSGTSTTT